ncbi:MAG: MBL fold metallo-hydrolase [Thermoguttaceae bacterium]|nr:MBL fold metallo-hydrolase [Thermoguttaceae bacterium]
MQLNAELKKNIDWVGYVDYNVRDFHSYDTRLGATYNAYLVRDEKVALIDTVKAPFAPQLIRNIANLVDLAKVDYVVCNHAEMDHSGALPAVMAALPNAVLVCNAKCRDTLAGLFDISGWKIQIVNSGDSLSLGSRSLTFVNIPMVHWPESMVSYMPEEKILFSNDAFGQHIATSGRFDDECDLPKILEEAKSYYANIVAPYGRQVLKTLETAAQLEIEMIAPSHGVIWRSHLNAILEAYPKWAAMKYAPKVLVIYDTMWNSTEAMAEEIYAGAVEYGRQNGVALDVQLMHARKTTLTRVAAEALDAGAVAFGSSTLNACLMPAMASVLAYFQGLKFREKTALAFGSFGWGPGGPEMIQQWLETLKYPALGAPIKAKLRPTPEVLAQCREAGAALAKAAIERAQADA